MTTLRDTVRAPARRLRVLRRPQSTTGFWSWFTTIDHKKIGIMYGTTALAFLVVGGVEALLLRLQLAGPNGSLLTAAQYNTLFTMHGTTMVFLMGMPLAVAFGNYLIPLQIGARDVAFPRLNAFGYWVVLFGGLFIYSSFFLGGAPNGGWFGYTPLTSTPISGGALPGLGPSFWCVGIAMLGIGSTTSAINFIVTVLNMRAPGMTLMRMPVFTWMMTVVAFLTVFAMPIITAAMIMVFFDRNYGTLFFVASKGGDPLLYQHLFWLFGHPEVYILILPGMGIVSEVLPVFSRKPLFGYSVVIFSGIAIGFYYWWPKIFGRMLNETLGKWNFWLMLLGFNLTFFPMHILGLVGMPRRTYRYPSGYGWDTMNMIETIGAFIIALSVLIFFVNIIYSSRRGVIAGNDPWDARSLEWSIPSPPPEYNFAEIPVVEARD